MNKALLETSVLSEYNSDTHIFKHPITVEINEEDGRAYVTIYETPSYPDIQQVIDCLIEENVPYWIDKEAIRNELSNKTTGKPFPAAYSRDGSFSIIADKNGLSASMILQKAYGGKKTTIEDIEEKLQEMGIISGIDHETILLALSENIYDTPFVIAKAIEPIHGTDAKIDCKFPLEFKMQPKLKDNKIVDFRELQLIYSVNKGDLLARKIPLTPGVPGKTITGRPLPAKPGKDIKFAAGRNSVLSSDGAEVTAEIEGQPFLRGKAIFVEPIYRVRGNVDYSVGNIDFKGSVIIDGDVVSGFSIKATDSIEIKGVVESCIIEAGMDVSIKGGILGTGNGILKAGRDFSSLFAQNCHIDAGRNIVIGDTLISNLSAGDSIDVTLGKGRVIGSKLSARNFIEMDIMGSEIAGRTQISVGHKTINADRLKKLKKDAEKTKCLLEKIEKHIQEIETQKENNQLSEEKGNLYRKLLATQEEYGYWLQDLMGNIEMLEQTIKRFKRPFIKVLNACYPNVRIGINHLVLDCTTEYHSAVFFEKEGKIKVNVFDARSPEEELIFSDNEDTHC